MPPNPTDVMRFTAEIDRNANRNRKSRQCGGTRLTNVLHAIQQFSTVVDVMVGGSQSQIACALWGTVKISLLVIVILLSLNLLLLLIQGSIVGLRHFVLFRSIIDIIHENWTYVSKISGFCALVS